MTDGELMSRVAAHFERALETGDTRDVSNLGLCGRFAWERKELGSVEAWQFAHRFKSPIVPVGHECHPFELIKRGWKPDESENSPIVISRWPQGTHFYAKINGEDVVDEEGNVKWMPHEAAFKAAARCGTAGGVTKRASTPNGGSVSNQ